MSKISDQQVEQLLPLVSDAHVAPDVKLAKLNDLKSLIKHFNVPEHLIPRLFEICRTSTAVDALVYTGLSTLGHLVKRVSLQDSALLVTEFRPTAPVLQRFIGDEKERFRLLALQCINDFAKVCSSDVNRFIAGVLTDGKPKAQVQALRWIADNSHIDGYTTFGPPVVSLLTERDPHVRAETRSVLVQLFAEAPATAKAELAKRLQDAGTSSQAASGILTEIGYVTTTISKPSHVQETSSKPMAPITAAPPKMEEAMLSASQKRSAPEAERPVAAKALPAQEAPKLTKRSEAPKAVQRSEAPKALQRPEAPKAVQRAVAPAAPAEVPQPTISGPPVSSQDLEKIFRDFATFFEGNESEKNWEGRGKTLNKLKDALHRGAAKTCEKQLGPSLRANSDNINKGIKSLRTTLSTDGCLLVQAIAMYFPAGIDLIQDIILPILIELCASTKKINASNGNQTVQKVFENSSNLARLLFFLERANGDKNVQPRQFATQWTKTLFQYHQHGLERTGFDIIITVIKKGLTDRDKGVRDGSRTSLWDMGAIWPPKATALIGSIEETTRRFLLADPKIPEVASEWFPADSLAKSRPAGRPSMKETVSQLRRQQVLSEPNPKVSRPASAQAVRPASSQAMRPPSATGTAAAPSLMSAPVRPMRQKSRADLTTPVTATPGSRPGSRANVHAAADQTPAKSAAEIRNQRSTEPPLRPSSSGRPASTYSEARSNSRIGHASTHHETDTSPRNQRASPRAKQASPSPQQPVSLGKSTVLHHSTDNHAASHRSHPSNGVQDVETPKPKMASPPHREAAVQQSCPLKKGTTPSPKGTARSSITPPNRTNTFKAGHSRSSSDSSSLSAASSILSETVQPPYSSSPPAEHDHEVAAKPDPAISRAQGLRQWARAERQVVPARGHSPDQPDQVLTDAITKLEKQKMDLHGFRKVAGVSQEKRIPENAGDAALPAGRWYDANEVGRLLIALCDYISTPSKDFSFEKKAVIDHKTQAFACLRQLLRNQRELVAEHLCLVLKCTLRLRADVPDQAHVVAACEQDAENIASWVPSEQLPDLLLSALEALHEGPHAVKSPSIRLGITVMTTILNRMKTESSIPAKVEGPLATFVLDAFKEGRVYVRKTIQPFFRLLDESLAGRPQFWGGLQDLPAKQKECFAYFKTRNSQVMG